MTSPVWISSSLPGRVGLLGGGYEIHLLLSPPNGVGAGPLCPSPQGLTDGPVARGDSRGPGKTVPHPGGPCLPCQPWSRGPTAAALLGCGPQPGVGEEIPTLGSWMEAVRPQEPTLTTSDVLARLETRAVQAGYHKDGVRPQGVGIGGCQPQGEMLPSETTQ